jgi:protein-S-isoprenylcysteine O-methyltransferase Ste14
MNAPMNTIEKNITTTVGRLWFQLRSYSPIPFVFLILFIKPDYPPTINSIIFPLLLILEAEALRVWSVGCVGSQTRTRGDHVPHLFHSGPYIYVRNPLYIANIILYMSFGFLFGHFYLGLGIFIYSVLEYFFIVSYEEELLGKLFGEPYTKYCQGVPRWVPKTTNYPSSGEQFNLKQGLRSERTTLIIIGLLLALFVYKTYFLK